MTRGTTPKNVFTFDVSLDGVEALYITYQQNGQTVVEKTIDDVEINTATSQVTVKLTQEDTLAFIADTDDNHCGVDANWVKIQVRIKYTDGTTVASGIIREPIQELLKDGEI